MTEPDRRREPWRSPCAESIGDRADRVVFVDIHARIPLAGKRDDRRRDFVARNRAVAAEAAVEQRVGQRRGDRRQSFAEALRPGTLAAEQTGTDEIEAVEAERDEIVLGLPLGSQIEIAALRRRSPADGRGLVGAPAR